MGAVTNYKDLVVWQRRMDLVEKIYRITQKLPETERWGLVSQMCRAAVSVPANIAEGYGRQSYRPISPVSFDRKGSLSELETHLILCQSLGHLESKEVASVLSEIEEILKMLSTLISKIR